MTARDATRPRFIGDVQKRSRRNEDSFFPVAAQNFQVAASQTQPEEAPLFDLAFGFIPQFNVGSALGVENDVARFAMDVLLDPFNLAFMFFSGGATDTN